MYDYKRMRNGCKKRHGGGLTSLLSHETVISPVLTKVFRLPDRGLFFITKKKCLKIVVTEEKK